MPQVKVSSRGLFKGTDPFLGGDFFYLWTDPAEINTEYVKLKKKYILFLKIFLFSEWFLKKIGFLCFFGYLFLKFQKNRSQKLSMLEQKQRQIWNLHEIPHKVMKPNFQFSFYYFHDRRSPNRNIFF